VVRLAGHQLVTGSFTEAVRNGRRSLALAQRFDLDDVTVQSLDRIGSALGSVSDPDGLAYQQASVDGAKRAGLVHDLCVSSANLGSQLIADLDRKSTRLNSSHDQISYAVFCLKKKKKQQRTTAMISSMSYNRR